MIKICEHCKCTFETKNRKKRFCNLSCSNAWQHANGIRRNYLNDKTVWEHWVTKYGELEAEEHRKVWLKKISEASSGENNPMFGRNDQCHGFRKENDRRRGKTQDEIYGVEKSQQIRNKRSASVTGEKNPFYGKISTRGGRSLKGHYKGFFFRSLLEYSFMKFQESLGREIGKDFRPYEIVIPYELEGRKRTYHPDFVVEPDNCIVEIKQSYALNIPSNLVKFEAGRSFAEKNGKQFRVLTERDFPKISFIDSLFDDDIVWDESSFNSFKTNWFKEHHLLLVEGVDRSGKSTIGKLISEKLRIPYFKPENDKDALKDNDRTSKMLRICDPYVAQMLKQTKVSMIIDRHYPSEWCYSHVLGRKIDEEGIWESDRLFAEIPATILIFKRKSYVGVSDESDSRLNETTLAALAKKYDEFAMRSKCKVLTFEFDEFDPTEMTKKVLRCLKNN